MIVLYLLALLYFFAVLTIWKADMIVVAFLLSRGESREPLTLMECMVLPLKVMRKLRIWWPHIEEVSNMNVPITTLLGAIAAGGLHPLRREMRLILRVENCYEDDFGMCLRWQPIPDDMAQALVPPDEPPRLKLLYFCEANPSLEQVRHAYYTMLWALTEPDPIAAWESRLVPYHEDRYTLEWTP